MIETVSQKQLIRVDEVVNINGIIARLISVVDVVITPMNPYQPIPFHILSFAVFQFRILRSSSDKAYIFPS